MESTSLTSQRKLAIVVPCYHWVSTTFFSNFMMMEGLGDHPIAVTNGVYLTTAMKMLMDVATDAEWDRLLIIEQDMICPRDTLKRHAAYTEPIVAGMYFRHEIPHHPIIGTLNKEKTATDFIHPSRVEQMLRRPKLYKVDVVGMGCTSIRRDVIESWPKDKPMWFLPQGKNGDIATSHDYYFCLEAAKHGFDTYVDTGLICSHLTEDATGTMHYMAAVKTGVGMEPFKKELMVKL